VKIVQISDTHISHLGGVTNENFAKIAEFVNEQLRPDFIVHTGDVMILDPDVAADRTAAKEAFTALQAPYRVLPGNHDVGETFEHAWADLHATPERVQAFTADFGPDRFVEIVGDYAIVGLNSEILAADFAEAQEQWAWLETVPEQVGDRPTLVFGHKPVFPPFEGPQEHQMSIPAAAAERLRAILADVDVKAWGSGHLHRYQLDVVPGAWAVSAPAVAFVGDTAAFPGLHQLGVVEYTCEDGEVSPAFRSIPTLDERNAMQVPTVAAAFAALGQEWPDLVDDAEAVAV
jgi:3',5'-cyclic AMP phosphodiesterase CpdA